MIRLAGVAVVAAALALSGCSTVQTARERIVRYVSPCENQTVQIYFEEGQAEVTPESRQVIAQAAQVARGCRVDRVTVMGLADAAGDPNANMELSRRRAQSVTEALAAAQLPAAQYEVTAVGQTGSVTAAGRTAPMRRRADIVLHMARR
jgi:peptidoglycan-associated lipoprotein